ncbi:MULTISPECIES: hypothetical protein, partial [unclassified Mameliella]|uniref:hypothetical protein n=1 Tax=unclassified Mameliella TaxID=2630630 RepID=UPI00273F1406
HISVRGSFLDADHPSTGSKLHAGSQYASMHTFDTYAPIDVAFKNAMTMNQHIYRFLKLRQEGRLPFDVIPRSQIN